jgi:hypothetical protein
MRGINTGIQLINAVFVEGGMRERLYVQSSIAKYRVNTNDLSGFKYLFNKN